MAYNYFEEEYTKEDLSKCIVEPKIELTVKEAKEIATLCGEAEFYAIQGENVKAKRHVGKARDLLVERIKQAEATKICNDYNKALNKVAEEFQKQEEIIRLKCEIEQLKAEQEVDNYLKDQFLKVWRTRNEY